MKKLILTSNGFENPRIGKEFLRVLGTSPSEVRVLFVPIASRTKEELAYVEESKKELLDLGIKRKNIVSYDFDKNVDNEELGDFDVVYICGGNTFYLLDKIRKSGFDKVLVDLVSKGIIYVGVSAGSILAGPDIEFAGASPDWDKNDVGIRDFSGLNLTDKIVSPHYIESEEEINKKFEERKGVKVVRLRDNQALVILGDSPKFIN